MEEVTGLGRDVRHVARPDRHRKQHDVHGGEACDRQAFHEPLSTAILLFLHQL
jgi:hypothetical protein